MIFTSYQHTAKTCSFCGRKRKEQENQISLYGYDTSAKDPTICDQCLVDCVNKARANADTPVESGDSFSCDFCGESKSKYQNLYTRGDVMICAECIGELIKIILMVGKSPGTMQF